MSGLSFGIGLPVAFDVLQAVGGLGNLALVGTVLYSKDVRRHSTWISFCCAWVVSSVSYLFLAFGGEQVSNNQPPFQYCLISAILSYGAPVLTAFAMLSVVIQLWFTVAAITMRHEQQPSPFRNYLLVAMPYMFWLVIILNSVIMGLINRGRVRRANSGLYCVIDNGIPGKINTVLCVLAMIATLGIEASIGIKARRHMRSVGSAQLPIGMLVRVVLFTAAGVVAIAMSFIFVTRVFSPLPNIFIALMPIAAVLIFGTQADILGIWFCRRRKASHDARGRISSTEKLIA